MNVESVCVLNLDKEGRLASDEPMSLIADCTNASNSPSKVSQCMCELRTALSFDE